MARRKRLKTVDEIALPEPTIQRIQSFLDAKQAAKTTVLSKSWYNAWLTHPTLDFDDRNFRSICSTCLGPNHAARFWNFVKKTVQRYEESLLKVERLKLQLYRPDSDSSSLTNELILKVVKMGVEEIDLDTSIWNHILPHEVLETETLVKLSLSRVRIRPPPDQKVICSRIKSLRLRDVYVGDACVPCSFPCLEDLALDSCDGFKLLDCPLIRSLCLKSMSIGSDLFSCSLPCLEYLTLEYCFGFKALDYSRVKSLTLRYMSIRVDFFSSLCPCLEFLTIDCCYGLEVLQISSDSLKFISLARMEKMRAHFVVPNIRKFKFSGSCYPSTFPMLSFTPVSREWESDISLHIHGRCLTDLWCYQLRRFIRKLSTSKISLGMTFDDKMGYMYSEELKGKPGPMVENLMLLNPAPSNVNSDTLDGLLWSCHPKMITQYWFPSPCKKEKEKGSNKFVKLLYKELIEFGKTWIKHDLKDVKAEYADLSCADWRPLLWKTLLSTSRSLKTEKTIRFHLEWCEK